MSIDALTKADAEALRSQIMEGKSQLEPTAEPVQQTTAELLEKLEAEEAEKEPILHLNPIDLLKVGISQNHLRSMGIIFAFVFTTLSQYDENWTELVANQAENYESYLPESGILLFAVTTILVLIISFLFSLINTVLKHFELSLYLQKGGLKVVRGLLNREEISINQSKIQIISWSENPIRRMFRLFTLQIEQASSAEASQLKSKIRIPGCYMEQVRKVITSTFPEEFFRDEPRHRVSILLKYRLFFFVGVVPAMLATVGLWFTAEWEALYALLWIPAHWFMVTLYYKKRSFELNEELLKNNTGIFGNGHDLMQLHKVQAVKVKQSWYQRRKAIATVQIFTAAGHLTVPFIPLQLALELENYLLYRAESDKREWM